VIATGDSCNCPLWRTSDSEPYDWAFLSRLAGAEFKNRRPRNRPAAAKTAFVQALAGFRMVMSGRCGAAVAIAGAEQSAGGHAALVYAQRPGGQVDTSSFRASGEESVLEAEQSGPEHQRQFLNQEFAHA